MKAARLFALFAASAPLLCHGSDRNIRGQDVNGHAVAVNGAVVPRPHWPSVPLAHGDQVEVIRAMQGG